MSESDTALGSDQITGHSRPIKFPLLMVLAPNSALLIQRA